MNCSFTEKPLHQVGGKFGLNKDSRGQFKKSACSISKLCESCVRTSNQAGPRVHNNRLKCNNSGEVGYTTDGVTTDIRLKHI